MKRKKFLNIAAASIVIGGVTYYLLSDKSNIVRSDNSPIQANKPFLQADENEILFLASLAPSGHNTQPWLVKYLEPFTG